MGAWFSGPAQARADQNSFQAGFSPLLLSTTLGRRSCWGVTGRGSGLGAMLLHPERFTPEMHQGCAIASRAGRARSAGCKSCAFILTPVCCGSDFPRDASSSLSRSPCSGMN